MLTEDTGARHFLTGRLAGWLAQFSSKTQGLAVSPATPCVP